MAQTKKSAGASAKKKAAGTHTKKGSTASVSKGKTVQNSKSARGTVEQQSLPIKESRWLPILIQLAPYILTVAALFLGFCYLFPDAAGIIGGAIRAFSFGLLSGASFTIPLFMIYHAIHYKANRDAFRGGASAAASAVCVLLIAIVMHLFAGGSDTLSPIVLYKDGIQSIGGGFFGGLAGTLMIRGFGKAGTMIIVCALFILLALFILGITPYDIWIRIRYYWRVVKERRAAAEEARAKEERRARHRAMLAKSSDTVSGVIHLPKTEPQNAASGAAQRARDNGAVITRMGRMADPVRKKKRAGDYLFELDSTAKTTVPAMEQNPVKAPEKEPLKFRIKKVESAAEHAAEEEKTILELGTPIVVDAPAGSMDGTEEFTSPVDEKIFDEVMRRTEQRIREAAKAADLAESVEAAASASGRTGFAAEVSDASLEKMADAELGLDSILPGTDLPSAFPEATADPVNSTKTAQAPQRMADEKKTPPIMSEELLEKAAVSIRRDKITSAEHPVTPVTAPPVPEPTPIPYQFPPIELLNIDYSAEPGDIRAELTEKAERLVETLNSFHVKTRIVDVSRGPTITRYELVPEAGTKVRSIQNLVDDIALNLATSGVRIEAPIPGKAAVGIEVPNKTPTTVYLRELIENEAFEKSPSKITASLGEDVAGAPIYMDIAKMPHLLIAGATGMGKSVCINSIIVSLLYKATPDELKLILIDPKKVELNIYNGIPHLLVPVVSDPKKAAGSLHWAVTEMERRFELIESVGMRDIKGYNKITADDPDMEFLPQVVIVIDELADLMMTAPDDVEESICRLAQKARAAGMHLLIGTQRPSVDVITGLIKSNIPSRIAFTTSSQIDSRTILDIAGAEKLVGRGDMLYKPVGAAKPVRVQGAFVSEGEVEKITDFLKNSTGGVVSYDSSVIEQIESEAEKCGAGGKKAAARGEEEGGADGEEDAMLRPAIELAIESGKISTSLIQRRLSLGYGRAAKLIDRMEQLGYVSAPQGQKPRDVIITKQEFMELVVRDEIR